MTKSKRERADLRLVALGLAESRSRAQAMIMAGQVLQDDRPVAKAGELLPAGANLRLKQPEHPWVSRGGLKLAHGLSHFAIDPADRICLDVGASTGGFTDVMLQRGAAKVYAVDVGHGQLAWRLRQDPKVVVLERTNARYLTRAELPEDIELLVCDASFIGLRTVLPAAMALCAADAVLIALIKPQFEVGKGRVGKGGVVRDEALHVEVCEEISTWLNGLDEWRVLGRCESPVQGPKGNKEFLICAQRAKS